MAMSYEPQTTQMNEELLSESYLNLTLMWHHCNENPKLRKVHVCFEVEPLRAWYYCISSNSRTLVILLQVDPAFGDEPKIVCENGYKIKDTSIFTWSSSPNVGHYRWLCSLIRQLLLNSKANYLVCTI